MTWGRAVLGGSASDGKVVNGDSNLGTGVRRINVLATGSVDQTIKVGSMRSRNVKFNTDGRQDMDTLGAAEIFE